MVHGPQHFFTTEETMSISGLTNSALDSLLSAAQSTQNGQGGLQRLEAEFRQLGQDLQTGNLTQAQEDYTTLSQNFQNAQNTTSASTTAANSNPITQAFAALSQSLQSGDLSAAQQDYATLQQDIQQQGTGQIHPHHHHGHGADQQDNQVSQALNALSTALQSGNLAGAQSAFATLTQTLQQLGAGGNSGSTNVANSSSSQSNGGNGSNVNVSV
jgi:Skp family chaperone for outer membrane proteins